MFGPFAPRTTRLIGRTEHVQAISDAIARQNTHEVIYLTGVGGIGKTRILEEVDRIASERGDEFLWSKIIDMYNAQNHSVGSLQQTIAQGLDPSNRWFGNYQDKRLEFEELQRQGMSGRALEDLRVAVSQAFEDAYRAAAKDRRIVLAFDTVELIQYENDVVQRVCHVEDPDTEVKSWFISHAGMWPNTVTLFAGRPRIRTQQDFERAFTQAGCKFDHRELTGLNDEDFEAYLADLIQQNQNKSEELQQPGLRAALKSLATGPEMAGVKPIRLILLIDLLVQPGGDLGALDAANIDALLIRQLHELRWSETLTDSAIYWLLYARKGLDAPLLEHLEGCSTEEAKAALATLADLAFVKRYQGAEHYFAHDELYDLFDRHFKVGSRNQLQYKRLRDYYVACAAKASTPETIEQLRLAQLYYELHLDPDKGYYECYARWDEEAIGNHESDFDMRLRDEALRFHNRYVFDPNGPFYDPALAAKIDAPKIHRDCAIRWVKRFIARGKLEQAIQASKKARYETDSIFFWEEIQDALYKAALLSAWGQALTYQGGNEQEITQLFSGAIALSTNGHQPQDENYQWWKARILGVAHNNYGYFHRTRGRYGEALKQYKKALGYFTTAGIETELANTSNNMAYLLALLGRNRAAKYHIDTAIKLRQEAVAKKPYQLALSRNTKGLILTLDDHPVWGERLSLEALAEGEKLNEPRLIGLACIGQGFALRRKAEQWEEDPLAVTADNARQSYQEAEQILLRAATIFERQITEPLRLWEAYNELGSLFCDWAHFTQVRDNDAATAREQYDRSIHYQEQALEQAEKQRFELQIADSWDDLAHVYSDRGKLCFRIGLEDEAEENWQAAERHLVLIEDHIPPAYHLRKGTGFDPELAAGEFYWLQLGKLHLQRAIWAFRDYELGRPGASPTAFEDGTKQFALAAAYFIQFWPESHSFGNTMDAMMKRLHRNKVAAELARRTVKAVQDEYAVDLSTVLRRIDDTLGAS